MGDRSVAAGAADSEAAAPPKPSLHVSGRDQREPGSYRRIGIATTGGSYDEALPPVGGTIKVQAHPEGYRFVVDARVDFTIRALIDVIEVENTFTATVEVGLEWEILEDQWTNCRAFWQEEFVPRVCRVFFTNADGRENIFDDDLKLNATVGKDELGAPISVESHFFFGISQGRFVAKVLWQKCCGEIVAKLWQK